MIGLIKKQSDLLNKQSIFSGGILVLFAIVHFFTKNPIAATVPITVLLAILTVIIFYGNFSEIMRPAIIGAALPMALAAAMAMDVASPAPSIVNAVAGLSIAVVLLATIKLITDLISDKRTVLFWVLVQTIFTDAGLYVIYIINP